jgi:hypothetical protein
MMEHVDQAAEYPLYAAAVGGDTAENAPAGQAILRLRLSQKPAERCRPG